MEGFATPQNTLGMSEPAPIETGVPAGFILNKQEQHNLSKYINKNKLKKLISYIKQKDVF